jgi:hypothetical protein
MSACVGVGGTTLLLLLLHYTADTPATAQADRRIPAWRMAHHHGAVSSGKAS